MMKSSSTDHQLISVGQEAEWLFRSVRKPVVAGPNMGRIASYAHYDTDHPSRVMPFLALNARRDLHTLLELQSVSWTASLVYCV